MNFTSRCGDGHVADWTCFWLELSTQVALERAGLRDVWGEVRERVLCRIYFDPDIRELLLIELRDIARMPHLSDEVRRERCEWSLFVLGY